MHWLQNDENYPWCNKTNHWPIKIIYVDIKGHDYVEKNGESSGRAIKCLFSSSGRNNDTS